MRLAMNSSQLRGLILRLNAVPLKFLARPRVRSSQQRRGSLVRPARECVKFNRHRQQNGKPARISNSQRQEKVVKERSCRQINNEIIEVRRNCIHKSSDASYYSEA